MGTSELKTIVVLSHDAGASEILCALIKENFHKAIWKVFTTTNAPMVQIATKNAINFQIIDNLNLQLSALEFDLLFFGTSWQNKIEREAVQYCKKNNIPSVAFLEHWSNFRERFDYPDEQWRENLGDFTALSDEKAFNLAQEFELTQPLKVPNYYLKNLKKESSALSNGNLLFLSEPTQAVALANYGDKNYWGFTQFSALEDILKNFEKFKCQGLQIRLHPSEDAQGFKNILKKYPHIKTFINPASFMPIEKQLHNAKMVIGFDTMALYIAAHLGLSFISYLPSEKRAFLLPLPSAHQIRNLSAIKAQHLRPYKLDTEEFGLNFDTLIQTVSKVN